MLESPVTITVITATIIGIRFDKDPHLLLDVEIS